MYVGACSDTWNLSSREIPIDIRSTCRASDGDVEPVVLPVTVDQAVHSFVIAQSICGMEE